MKAPLAIALLASGCSLLTTDYQPCDDNLSCRERFGRGFVCGSSGFCEETEPPSRCTSRDPLPLDLFTADPAGDDTILFGSLMNRSIVTHIARENSARLALTLANDAGGLTDGRKFGMVFCTIEENPQYDALTEDQAAVEMGRYLTEVLGVPALFGPSRSDTAQAVFQDLVTARANEVLIISPSATSPSLTALDPPSVDDDNPGLLWRTAPPDSLQGLAIAEDMRLGSDGRLGIERAAEVQNVGLIFEGGAYGDGLADVFRVAFASFGGSVVTRRYVTDGERSEAIAAVGMSDVEEVLFISSDPTQLVAFINAAELPASGFSNKKIFLPDGAANPDVLDAVAPALRPSIRGTRPAPLSSASSVYGLFVVAYSGAYEGEDPGQYSFTAHSYDAAWLLTYGAAWAEAQEGGVVSARNLAKGLRHVSFGGLIEILASTYETVKQRFGAGLGINVDGASGKLDFDPATEETSGAIQVWRIDDNGQILGLDVLEP